MGDAVDRLIEEREAMDHGFQGGVTLSVVAHVILIGGAIAGQMLGPKEPPIKVIEGFAVPLPPGGGGPRTPEVAPAAAPETAQPDAPPAPEPPPKLIRPPSRSEPPKTKGLAQPDAKKAAKKTPKEDARAVPNAPPNPASKPQSGGVAGGTGKASATPGFDFGPPGPGVPTGTDMMGDWYLAGVQRKIWSIWMQQIKTEFNKPIAIQFTIQQDGSLGDVTVLESSGSTLLDLAAKRAIYSAAPFGPLPKTYGTSSYTIQGIFRPTAQ